MSKSSRGGQNNRSNQMNPNNPENWAARARSPPEKDTISFGSTGTMMPSASMSSRTVTKTNANAARVGTGGR